MQYSDYMIRENNAYESWNSSHRIREVVTWLSFGKLKRTDTQKVLQLRESCDVYLETLLYHRTPLLNWKKK